MLAIVLLQMMGRASRPNIDDGGRCVLMCHTPRKEYYKKVRESIANRLQHAYSWLGNACLPDGSPVHDCMEVKCATHASAPAALRMFPASAAPLRVGDPGTSAP